jgi:hypothetical protein
MPRPISLNLLQVPDENSHLAIRAKIKQAQVARLIPCIKESNAEGKATSSFLASLMVVPTYAESILKDAGAPVLKNTRILCLTEVVFVGTEENPIRPDGLIIVDNGKKSWTALVEAKVGNADLSGEQIEGYLDLAKGLGIDALITLSNQFATLPTHHPVQVSKAKTRKVALLHFSWQSIISTAAMLSENRDIDDPEQAYILSQLIQYLTDSRSKVTTQPRMSKNWKLVTEEILKRSRLTKTDPRIQGAVFDWHQLLRYLVLNLGAAIGKSVDIYLSRAMSQDPRIRAAHDAEMIARDNHLRAEFKVPNAAARVNVTADFLRRTINLSMKIQAPDDKKMRQKTALTWFLKQLKHLDESGLIIRAHWPKRVPMTSVSLDQARLNPESLVPPNFSDKPSALEVMRVVDLGARFGGAKNFVEACEVALPRFYSNVVQHMTAWVPKPPQLKARDAAPIRESAPEAESSSIEQDRQALPSLPKQPWEPWREEQPSHDSGSAYLRQDRESQGQ